MNKHRLQFGSQIVEIVDQPESESVLLTVSKERWDEDRVQLVLPRYGAVAIGSLLSAAQQFDDGSR